MLIIQHTMTKSLELGIGNLITEFLTDALVFFGFLEAAGAIASTLLKSLLYGLYDFLVFVKSNFRFHIIPLVCFVIVL